MSIFISTSISIYLSILRDFKYLAHVIVWAGKSEICRTGWRLRGEVDVALLSLKANCRQNSFFLGGSQSFLLVPSTDYVRPNHIMVGNLFYSKSTDLKVNLI